MCNYYNNSWLTIGAGVESDNSGIFGHITPNNTMQRLLHYSRSTPLNYYQLAVDLGCSNNGGKSNLYFNNEDESIWNNCAGSLLNDRAWTLQEEALSPRFLSFQPRQTSLRNGDAVHHESGYSEKLTRTTFLNLSGSNLMPWRKLVEDYSKRKLTIETDKLPAFSGLAQKYQQNGYGIYLAGLWYYSLKKDLCWWGSASKLIPSLHRPKQYRAPSWSWASLDGGIFFYSVSDKTTSPHLEILDASTQVAGRNPLGQVSSGSLRLRGELSHQLWKHEKTPNGTWYWSFAHPLDQHVPNDTLSANVPRWNAKLILDIPEGSVASLEIWSLPIKNNFALVLQEVPNIKGTFTRIGCILSRNRRYEGYMKVDTVTII